MTHIRRLFHSALKFVKSKTCEKIDEISNGLDEKDALRVVLNVGRLVLPYGITLLTGIALFKLIAKKIHVLLSGIFLATALYSAVLKFLGVEIDDGSSEDSVSITLAEQEAEEVHEDLLILAYNAVAETSEYMPIRRPRDMYGIETSREKPYRMEGVMAVHQFEIDCDHEIDRETRDKLIRELQRHTNQQSRRYPSLIREGYPPIVYDVKRNGNFLLLEMVLYSQRYSEKIEARKRARVENAHRQERIDDPRYK